jgi:hypothetical protein
VADEEREHRPGEEHDPVFEEISEFTVTHHRRPAWPWMIAGATVVICAIVYFSFDGPPDVDNASATMGPVGARGVEQVTAAENGGVMKILRGAVSVPATDSSARLLRTAAQTLGIMAQDLAAKKAVDADVVATVARAAAETNNAAQAALDGYIVMDAAVMADVMRHAGELQRAAAGALALRGGSEARQEDSLRIRALDLERMSLACQPALDAGAVTEVARASATLNQMARDLGTGDRTDTSIMADLHRMSFELDRASHLMSRGGSIDRLALAGLIQQAREIELQSASMARRGPARQREKLADLERLAAAMQRDLAILEQTASAQAQ